MKRKKRTNIYVCVWTHVCVLYICFSIPGEKGNADDSHWELVCWYSEVTASCRSAARQKEICKKKRQTHRRVLKSTTMNVDFISDSRTCRSFFRHDFSRVVHQNNERQTANQFYTRIEMKRKKLSCRPPKKKSRCLQEIRKHSLVGFYVEPLRGTEEKKTTTDNSKWFSM